MTKLTKSSVWFALAVWPFLLTLTLATACREEKAQIIIDFDVNPDQKRNSVIAKIKIDGKLVSTAGNNGPVASATTAPGAHLLTVEALGYETFEEECEIAGKQTFAVVLRVIDNKEQSLGK